MKTVAVILNPEIGEAVDFGQDIVPWLQEQTANVVVEHEAAAVTGFNRLSRDKKQLTAADFALVLGGDGTLLRASRMMSPVGVPMLAIRLGEFGFMTDTEPADARAAIDRVLEGRFEIDERMMLHADVRRAGRRVNSAVALNDIVIAKGALARMLDLGTYVSEEYISTYASDGLIVATPTGSTAYSLSAGGPIVTPDLSVMIVTPICPHTLNARSLVISSNRTVKVVVEDSGGDVVMLTADGQLGMPLDQGDEVVVGEAGFKAKLISVGGTTFFKKLQTRLRWGDRFDL